MSEDGLDNHALMVEQRGLQPVPELQAAISSTAVSGATGGFGHGESLERSVGEQSGVAFDIAGIVAVVVNAVGVVGECREANRSVGETSIAHSSSAAGDAWPSDGGQGACTVA